VTTRSIEPAMNLDTLAAHWRTALDLAADALQVANGCRTNLGFPAEELDVRRGRLARERDATAQLLALVAHDERVQLHRSLSAPRTTAQMLGLPAGVLACVFDLDGVLTGSAAIHAAAWSDAFEEFLSRRLERTGERFAAYRPFNPRIDYYQHLHGRPRLEGAHAFLASRGIRLPEGHIDDPTDAETVHGIANRKRQALLRRLDREGVEAYADTRLYLEAAREAGLRLAVVSASANTSSILEHAALDALITERIDGNLIRAEHLRGKPAPDTLLAACRRLRVPPSRAAVFETTHAGVVAARAAGFAFVVGVDRPDRVGSFDAGETDVAVAGLAALLDPALAL
jgi:HAD superfamily hydrolase (TIGR01509 family)